jgi:hypothetical protein
MTQTGCLPVKVSCFRNKTFLEMNKDSVLKILMRSKNMIKISRFLSVTPLGHLQKKRKIKISIRAVGSVCKPAGILNRSAGSGAMQAWRQDNFVEVLNRPAGSEAMSGK